MKGPPCWYHTRICPTVPRYLFGIIGCHWVVTQSLLWRPSIVQYVLLHKHLYTIPLIVLVPDTTGSAWNLPRQGQIWSTAIKQLLISAQPDSSETLGYWHLPTLHPTLNGDSHSPLMTRSNDDPSPK